MRPIHIIGGGLAGSEAAWQAAKLAVDVVLHEMRPVRMTEAHQTSGLAELVCSNSLRSDDWENNAVGLLHEEMRRANSLVLASADISKVPAGGALAVDREAFSQHIQSKILAHPRITLMREEVSIPSRGMAQRDYLYRSTDLLRINFHDSENHRRGIVGLF